MTPKIIRLGAADFDDAMDFLNLIFGAYRPHDFENLLPSMYQRTDESMSCNYAIRENGRIRAIVGMFPRLWSVGGTVLKVAGIGGVSTHPRSRGAGHMKLLMDHCLGVMREEGYHLSWLSGQRQRYQHFGYERCGQLDCLSLNQANLRHCFTGEPGIRFRPIEAGDAELLETARKLHDTQLVRCLREPGSFPSYLRNWQNRPYAALDDEGRMGGYLVATPKGERLTELVARDDRTAMLMLRAWTTAHGEGDVTVELPAWRTDLLHSLGSCCEGFLVRSAGNWRIFDWPFVLRTLLGLRRQGGALMAGTVTMAIEGYGTLALDVSASGADCRRTDASPDITLDAFGAMRVLLGPTKPSRVTALAGRAALLDQWCPLPASLPGQDSV